MIRPMRVSVKVYLWIKNNNINIYEANERMCSNDISVQNPDHTTFDIFLHVNVLYRQQLSMIREHHS